MKVWDEFSNLPIDERGWPCRVKAGRMHNAECACEAAGSLHNRNRRIERGEKVWA